jgi:hypothetical protein
MTSSVNQEPITLILNTAATLIFTVPMNIIIEDSKTIKLIPKTREEITQSIEIGSKKETLILPTVMRDSVSVTETKDILDQENVSSSMTDTETFNSKQCEMKTEAKDISDRQNVSSSMTDTETFNSEQCEIKTENSIFVEPSSHQLHLGNDENLTPVTIVTGHCINNIEKVTLVDKNIFTRLIDPKDTDNGDWYYFNLGRKIQFLCDKHSFMPKSHDDSNIVLEKLLTLTKDITTIDRHVELTSALTTKKEMGFVTQSYRKLTHLLLLQQCLLGRDWQFLLDNHPSKWTRSRLDKLDLGKVSCEASTLVININCGAIRPSDSYFTLDNEDS